MCFYFNRMGTIGTAVPGHHDSKWGEGHIRGVALCIFILAITQHLSHYFQTWILWYIFIQTTAVSPLVLLQSIKASMVSAEPVGKISIHLRFEGCNYFNYPNNEL